MKKLLSFLAIFSLSCTKTVNLISCGNIANNKPHLPPAKPKEPIVKDVFYYEKLKQEITAEIKEYDEVIKEIENSKNDYENETDYHTELNQSQAEKFIKMSELNNCEYQILLCQKENEFTDEQKQQAIKLLKKQINNLNSTLNLLSENKNSDFDQKDLEKINTKIKNIKTILDEIKNN
ncbi:hypothetical protein [Spiroplasma citri]|uniref:Lipoprotein n=1 Tax=Spiroplasma citri TaxID=2133 RepID=A0AAJ4EIM6_SPICI|nr:hypothetical protein [Spiroplasma citri]QED24418.1 hypothetical protein FRX96_02900 [Spiroplasma citri]QIA66700.1 hypothetical protein GMI18_02990 [Spiroplasma citri]QIA68572.1 hypothetical protein GL298_03040 [Spiroplasma citri]QIA70443.1 hypothetical protein GL981_03040 [Spiroplasma citri]QIA72682.1 hypothetical protein GL982_03055 [Spiroplasma citri]